MSDSVIAHQNWLMTLPSIEKHVMTKRGQTHKEQKLKIFNDRWNQKSSKTRRTEDY